MRITSISDELLSDWDERIRGRARPGDSCCCPLFMTIVQFIHVVRKLAPGGTAYERCNFSSQNFSHVCRVPFWNSIAVEWLVSLNSGNVFVGDIILAIQVQFHSDNNSFSFLFFAGNLCWEPASEHRDSGTRLLERTVLIILQAITGPQGSDVTLILFREGLLNPNVYDLFNKSSRKCSSADYSSLIEMISCYEASCQMVRWFPVLC